MLNIFAKCLLVSTSLSPVLGTVAINQYERGEPWTTWIVLIVIAFLLIGLCHSLLRYARCNAQKHWLYIQEFERKDQEMLAFLFIYLLPLLRSDPSTFVNEWLTSIFVLVIVILAIAHAGAFHFNPVMRLLGYRFYAVKNRYGVSNLLISKKDIRQPRNEIQTVSLAWNVYLYIGDSNA